MCDVYETHCAWCGRKIPVHIGDFSTSRQAVRVFCWEKECQHAMLAYLQGYDIVHREGVAQLSDKWLKYNRGRSWYPRLVFIDWVFPVSESPRPVFFVVEMPHSICLNDDPELDKEEV